MGLLLVLSQTANAAEPFPSTWIPMTQSGVGLGDVTTDGSNNGREVVGDETDPALYVAFDGSAFFIRLRIDTDPLTATGTGLRPYGWGLLINTDGDFTAYEYSLMVDGIGTQESIEFAGE